MKRSELLEFTWYVPSGGYCWSRPRVVIQGETATAVEGEAVGEDYLTDLTPLGSRATVRLYSPLLSTGLFRVFAETPTTPDGVLAFANEYGALGATTRLISVPANGDAEAEDSEERLTLGRGETLSTWADHMGVMRRALDLWEATRQPDLALLERHLARVGKGVRYDSHPDLAPTDLPPPPDQREFEWIASTEIHPERLALIQSQNSPLAALSLAALWRVQGVINQHLAGSASPRLLWETDQTRPRLHFVPGSLIGALWLQFAQAVDDNLDFHRCDECRKWFVLSPTVARASRLYCSNACRTRAYRKRREDARRLRAEGMPFEDIARALGSDVGTVQGWVEGTAEKW